MMSIMFGLLEVYEDSEQELRHIRVPNVINRKAIEYVLKILHIHYSSNFVNLNFV